MNRELAIFLRNHLQHLPFVDKITGLVKTISYQQVDENSRTRTISFPASLDTTEVLPEGGYSDLVPDSTRYRSIFYFEDQGCRATNPTRGGYGFTSSLRLVAWLNQSEVDKSITWLVTQILAALPKHLSQAGFYRNLTITPGRILGVEDGIFNKYSYDETVRQYLLFPYTSFAIDLSILFIVPTQCMPSDGQQLLYPNDITVNAEV